MGQSPKESPKKLRSSPCRLCSGTITSLLSTGVPHIYSYQHVDDHREREYHTAEHTNNKSRVSQSTKDFIHIIRYIFTISYTYINQACYDSSDNTLRHDSTHPDTSNLVGFSECSHLWWIPLLTPELCVTSVTVNQFPSPQGQPLMNFRPLATLTTGVSLLQVRLTNSLECQDATLP